MRWLLWHGVRFPDHVAFCLFTGFKNSAIGYKNGQDIGVLCVCVSAACGDCNALVALRDIS